MRSRVGPWSFSTVAARLRSWWRGLWRRGQVEAEMGEEFRHHMELRTEHLIREGIAPAAAARQARSEFGHVESHKVAARAARGLHVFDQMRFSWLDVKLGLRMLKKYPGLSLVAVVGMSVTVAIGAGSFGWIYSLMDPTLPLAGGDRLVSLLNNDVRNPGLPGNPNRHSLHDFVLWRTELTRVQDVGAFITARRNVVNPDGSIELVTLAQMSAAGFRVAGVAPVRGRVLVDDDELSTSPPVVVLAHEEWQRRFSGDPAIVGRQIKLGTAYHTVVGVMPAGFRFPINHRFWVPLRLNPNEHPIGGGPEIFVFGRLAANTTLAEAQTELAAIGARMSATHPQTHEQLRPRVLHYAPAFFDFDSPAIAWAFHALQLAISLLLVVVAVNVSILIYARTATRLGEIAVRSALGASRRRVIGQLFAEALVLSAIAATIGLAIAGWALDRAQLFMERSTGDELPFWLDVGLSPGVVVYTAALAILAGVIVGVIPALKATGRSVQARLQQLASRGLQMRLGRTWTALIVLQVAVAVALLPFAVYAGGKSTRLGTAAARYPDTEILRATVTMDRQEAAAEGANEAIEAANQERFRSSARELLRRLEAEPPVAGVTFGRHFPGEEWGAPYEVEGIAGTRWLNANEVDVDLFHVFDVDVLAGRAFTAGDAITGAASVIVDRGLADRVLGGGDVIGRRVRRAPRNDGDVAGPWLQIVGVVPEFITPPDFETHAPVLYEPVAEVRPNEFTLALRLRGTTPAAFADRLRAISAAVNPDLQLEELESAAVHEGERRQGLLAIGVVVVAVTASVLLLSAAGIYAMMSFTVARRRREIGIRAALGANPRRLLGSIFARASAQLGAGVLAGLGLAGLIALPLGGELFAGKGLLLLPLVAGGMIMVGLLATLGPARRGLAVQPTEALRDE